LIFIALVQKIGFLIRNAQPGGGKNPTRLRAAVQPESGSNPIAHAGLRRYLRLPSSHAASSGGA
jgi:hypothetical protein